MVRGRIFVIGVLLVIVVSAVVAYSELVASKTTSGTSLLLGSNQMPPDLALIFRAPFTYAAYAAG